MTQYFATVARGLEDLAAQELESLGAQQVSTTFAGVGFEGDRSLLYRVNLWARLPFRILMQLTTFSCANDKALYRGIQSIDWSQYLTPEQTLAVRATGKNPQLNHTHFSALQVKNAIVDQQRQTFGERSSVDLENPDLAVNIHIQGSRCTVSLDSSGGSLHRRGYRPAVGAAPLKETLAAALIQLSDWTPDQPFLDPLCGSGTLPIEAGLKALNIAPGLFRDRFGFEFWHDFDAELWDQLQQEAEAQELSDLPNFIGGSDRDPDVLEQAQQNAYTCGLAHQITFQQREFADLEAPADSGVLMCNPPYGDRLGRDQDLAAFYKLMGDRFKQRFKGWTVFVLTGNLELAKCIGLRPSRRFVVYNGTIECRLLKYEMY
ncbi:MAG: RNA methyltransferase [Leptolyngbya sp. DLM2.Bin15]|nr:MAG: RNA methyltransferase [Leptolyngbya sp. DLM2.Bin15]